MRGRIAVVVAVVLGVTGLFVPPPVAEAQPGTSPWRGEPTGIAGTARYDDGEWVYTDYVYDDYGADTAPVGTQPQVVGLAPTAGDFRYPDGDAYRDNAADIVEVRTRVVGRADLQVRVVLSTLVDPSVPALWTSVDGVERIVTAQNALVDAVANTVTFVVPGAVDGGPVELNVAAGLAATGGGLRAGVPGSAYLQPDAFTTGGPTSARLFDLAFNTEDIEPRGAAWNEDVQSTALQAGDLAPFAQVVDTGLLRSRATTPVTLEPGYHVRVFESRQDLGEGVAGSFPEYRSRYQPYAVWVPADYDPARPAPLFLAMHSLSVHHNQYRGGNSGTYASFYDSFGDANGAVVVTPLGRGPDGWYEAEGLVDTMEVWADALQRFSIDRDAVAVGGYSMGGYGTYRLSTLMPDAFAAASVQSGPMTNGIEPFPSRDASVDNTYNQLESARHVPTYITHGTDDELVPVSGVVEQAERYGELGHEYRFALYPGHDHLSFAATHDWIDEAAWLRDHPTRRTDPGRVTLAIRPAALLTGTDESTAPVIRALLDELAGEVGAHLDGGYWVSGVDVDDPMTIGRVDLRSGGRSVRTATPVTTGGAANDGAYVLTGADQSETPPTGDDILSGSVSGVRELTVDVSRAGVTLDAVVAIDTDIPLLVRLRDGDASRTVEVAPRG